MLKVRGILFLFAFLVVGTAAAQLGSTSADSLFQEGRSLQRAFKYLAANEILKEATRLYEEGGLYCQAFKTRIEIAYNLLDDGQDDNARSSIDHVSRDFHIGGCRDSLILGDLHLARFNIYRNLGQVDLTRKAIEEALVLAETLKTRGLEYKARVLNNFASFYAARGANYQALQAAEESMDWKRRHLPSHDRRYLTGLYAIANYSERTGDYERAYLSLDTLIQLGQNAEGYSLSNAYHLLSLVCLRRQEYDIAKKYASLAIDLFSQEFGPQSRAVSYGFQELGSACLGLNNPDAALDNYQKAFALRSKFYGPYHRLTLSSLSSITKAEMILGDTLTGIEKYKKIVQHFKIAYDISNAEKYALNTIKIGELYQGMGQLDSAHAYFQRALDIANDHYQAGDRIHSEAHICLSSVGDFAHRKKTYGAGTLPSAW